MYYPLLFLEEGSGNINVSLQTSRSRDVIALLRM